MEVSLYRKYRPQKFSDIVGQEHVVKTLMGALKSNKIAHAYLFCGPKATGKTSVARILAKAINCQNTKEKNPCDKCSSCISISEGNAIDVIEIDAASSRGIDEIRELREKIKFSPTLLKYKIFIIDEVHMLTKEAFNALLKTLEEPPPHAIFMLITTEVHKIPQTIISRCQRFDFRKIKSSQIIKRLEYIAKKEKINLEGEVLKIIALNSGGGLRDAISILDQASSLGEKVTISLLKDLLGFTETKTLASFLDFIIEGKNKDAVSLINQVQESGADLSFFCDCFINYLRNILIYKTTNNSSLLDLTAEEEKKIIQQSGKISKEKLIFLIEIFLRAKKEIKEISVIQLPLEMAAIEAIKNFQVSEEVLKEEKQKTQETQIENSPTLKESALEPISKSISKKKERNILKQIQENWDKVIEKIKNYNHSLAVFLKSAEPVAVEEDNLLVILFLYEFHKARSLEGKNKIVLEKIISEIVNVPISIKGKIKEKNSSSNLSVSSTPKENSPNPDNNIFNDALEIFKGKIIE